MLGKREREKLKMQEPLRNEFKSNWGLKWSGSRGMEKEEMDPRQITELTQLCV